MQFDLTEAQAAVRDLAAEILSDRCTPDRLSTLEADGVWPDGDLWASLADAGLLGVALPEDLGGAGEDFVAMHLLLVEAGRTVAPVPLWQSVVLGALPLATFGTPDQRSLAADIAAGTRLATAALVEDGRGDPTTPLTTARREGGAWVLEGVKSQVPIPTQVDATLVTARVEGGAPDASAVFVVDPAAEGVTVVPQEIIGGWPAGRLELSGAPAQLLGEDVGRGPEATRWLVDHAQVGLASLQAGVCLRAVRLAADYTATREQFGKKIATFQAVGQRVADAYIDAQGIELTALHAAWLLGAGIPCADEVATAKFWAADGGHRVLHAAHHVHGGVGIDTEYELYRYFEHAKQVEFTLGGATSQLLSIGASMAAEPADTPA